MSSNHGDSDSDDNFNTVVADLSDDEGNSRARNDRRRESSTNGNAKPAKRSRQVDDDDDEGGEDGEGEDDEEGGGGGDDDDEEDEDEDEEDEDDVQTAGHRRKRRRENHMSLFDMEAEVDDEDEVDDDERDGEEIEDFIDNAHPDDIADSGRLDDDRRHRDLDRQREIEASFDAEKLAENYKERYGKRAPVRGHGEGAVVPKRLLLPSVQDPGIWAVRCKEGKEREIIFSIIKKVEEFLGTANEIQITSAFERGGVDSIMKGYIYMEAQSQNDVMKALDGIFNVYPRTKMELVPIKDMPDLLRVTKTPNLEPGAYVRMRKPARYAGDLAQVLDVTENGLEARVRFIPRLDYGGRDDLSRSADGKRKRPGIPGPRPPQRLFSDAEARKRNPRQLTGSTTTGTWNYNGDEFENGFMVKDIKIQQLQVKDVNPTLEEVTKFASGAEDGAENLDLKALAASLKDSNANLTYLPGDVIEVYGGEQKGVIGKATNVRGDIVTLRVTEGDLVGQTIDVPAKNLRKRFREGDHVKVVGGSRYRDEVGMVVNVKDDRVTLLTDQTNTEITVFSRDLREADDLGGHGSLGQYSLLDLVQLDPTTVGCIVKIDRESMVVLDQNGDTRQVMPSQISNQLPKRKMAVAADRNGSEIRLDDVVREYGAQQRQGKIIHIHRSFVYLHSNELKENAGVFVTRAGSVTTISAKGGRVNADSGPDLNAMNPALQRNPNGANKMQPPKIIGRDKAIGQTVSVRKGGYKGLLGIVKDTTDSHARVELHTKSKIITVPKVDLIFKDKVTGRPIDIYGRGGPRPSGGYGGSGDGGRTPARGDGGRTPSWSLPKSKFDSSSARTPAWAESSSRTPAWADAGRGDGSRTVNPYDGSRTSYGGATSYGSGSRTPAWSANAKTPFHDSFGAGSKTPAYGSTNDSWGSGSKTPAYGISAPTPGASGGDTWGFTPGLSGPTNTYEDAPTPGGALSAPTPGAMLGETPGAYAAPTPAVSAPTPAAWQGGWGAETAPTPAASAPTPAASGGYYGAPTPGAYGGAPETPAASGPRYTDDD